MRDTSVSKKTAVPGISPNQKVDMIHHQPRSTYFSDIMDTVAKAAETIERQRKLESSMVLQVFPETVQISDYSPGQLYRRDISIRNYSKKIKRVTIEAPKTSYFHLGNTTRTDEITIVPGMEYTFSVEFHAPVITKPRQNPELNFESSPSTADISPFDPILDQLPVLADQVALVLEDGHVMPVPVMASPSKSCLEIPSRIDFGICFTSHYKSMNEDGIDEFEGGIVRHVEIRNSGAQKAKFDVVYNKSLPIRVTPQHVVLDAAGTVVNGVPTDVCQLKVQVIPTQPGKFKHEIHLEVCGKLKDVSGQGKQRQRRSAKARLASSHVTMLAVGHALDHKMRIKDMKNFMDVDPQKLSFGSIYFGETSYLSVRLENRSSKPLNWVISHAGESKPYVPGETQEMDASEAEKKTAVSVYPSEGILPPHELSIVTFKFSPTLQGQAKGFSTTFVSPEPRTYHIPMQLNILGSHKKVAYGEDPIDLLLTGQTCPLLISASRQIIHFEATPLGQFKEETFQLKNSSDTLGLKYEFDKMANLIITPSVGKLLPLQSTQIKVTYKPHQMGPLKSYLECRVSSLACHENMPEEIQQLRKRQGFSIQTNTAKVLNIQVTGECFIDKTKSHVSANGVLIKHKPSPKKSSFEDQSKLFLATSLNEKKGTLEWESKCSNRSKYIQLLKDYHAEKAQQNRIKKFGRDGVQVDYTKISLYQHYDHVDAENGLVEPEVNQEDSDIIKRPENIMAHPNKFGYAFIESTTTHKEDRTLKELIEKLFEPIVHKCKTSTLAHPHASINANLGLSMIASAPDSALTGVDLSNFFASRASMDVGTITTHSTVKFPVNFLNATPSRKPIHVSFLQKRSSGNQDVHISPRSIVIPPMSVVGVEFTLSSHEPCILSEDVAYIVNGRYKYHILVTGTVVPVNLTVDQTDLTITTAYSDIKERPDEDQDMRPESEETTYQDDLGLKKPMGKLDITNDGNYAASFALATVDETPEQVLKRCLHPSKPDHIKKYVADIKMEGSIEFTPKYGKIQPQSKAAIEFYYVPGVKPNFEEQLVLYVLDTFDPNNPRIIKTIPVHCQGETDSVNCSIVTTAKSGYVDLGTIQTGFNYNGVGDFHTGTPFFADGRKNLPNHALWKYNAFASCRFHSLNKPVTTPKQVAGIRTVKIKNNSSVPCYFTAKNTVEHSEIVLSSQSGFVPAAGIFEIIVTCIPTRKGLVEDILVINITGAGKSYRIPVRYDGRALDLQLMEGTDEMDNNIIVGSTTTKNFTLSNESDMTTRTVIDLRDYPEFEVRLNTGPPDLPAPKKPFSRRGSSQLGMPSFTALPSVRSHLGSISVLNASANSDARRQAFKVLDKHEIAQKNARITVVGPNDDLYTTIERQFAESASNILTAGGIQEEWYRYVLESFNKPENIQKSGYLYVIDVNPNENMDLQLVFKPKTVKRYTAEIPIRILGNDLFKYLNVDAEVITSPILVSKTVVDFQHKVLHADPSVVGFSNVAKETITITNQSNSPYKWFFDVSGIDQKGIFRMEPFQGALAPHQSQSISIFFNPENILPQVADVNMYVDCLGNRSPFTLQLKGTGVEPSLAFDPPEISLPVSPFNLESTITFSVINYGCERTELKYSIPQETLQRFGRLELFFPEGRLLKGDGEKLAVSLKFLGNGKELHKELKQGALSFALKIEFLDQNGKQFYLPTRGTFDASFLTLQPYLWSTRSTHCYIWNENNKTISYQSGVSSPEASEHEKRQVVHEKDLTCRAKVIGGQRQLKSLTGLALETKSDLDEARKFYEKSGLVLLRWFEDHLGMPYDLGEFPDPFVGTEGRLLFDFIYSLSGKRFYGQIVSGAAASTKQERISGLIKQYTDVINQLQSFGALLNNIKPEYLLSKEDFKQNFDRKQEKTKTDAGEYIHDEHIKYIRRIEMNFDIFSKEAWTVLVLQIVRIFVAQNVTMKGFKALTGLDKEDNDSDAFISSKSNIFSPNDIVLLRWTGYHYYKQTGQHKRFTNFSQDFEDLTPFAYLLLSHVPEFKQIYFTNVHLDQDSEDTRHRISKCLRVAFSTLFPNCPGVSDFSFGQLAKGKDVLNLDVYLLILFLYQALPQFTPKSIIDLKGPLHEKITKFIDINNNSSRNVVYQYAFQQTSDFSLDVAESISHPPANMPLSAPSNANVISVPARSSIKVPISFVSRFAATVRDQVVLKSKKMGLNNNSILVFLLNGIVDRIFPKKTFRIEAPMYSHPPLQGALEIVNPFSVPGKFKVTLTMTKSAPYPLEDLLSSRNSVTDLSTVEKKPFKNPPSLHISIDEMELEANATKAMTIAFVPFIYGLYEANLHFVDENVGEFSYKIEAKSSLPSLSDSYHWTCRAQGSVEKSIKLHFANAIREKAIHALDTEFGVVNEALKSELEYQLDSTISVTPPQDVFALPRDPLRYRVEYSSHYFQGPSEILLQPPREVVVKSKGGLVEKEESEIPVAFHPKLPGKYNCRVTLIGLDTCDIRVFTIQGSVMSQGSSAELDFTTPARVPLVQEIPIFNQSSEEWSIKSTLQGSGFTGPLTLICKPNGITHYPLVFCPIKSGDVKGLLVLSNLTTGQKHTYYLKGYGQDPPPQDTVQIKCVARDKLKHTFMVTNYNEEETEFEVVTDIPHAHGLASLVIPGKETVPYELDITALISGTFSRSIHFVSKADKSFTWYSVHMHIRQHQAEASFDLSVTVRKALEFEICLVNPVDRPISYKVVYDGQGLKGDKQVDLLPLEDTKYALTYAPVVSQRCAGYIKFINEDLGEFWYELQLEAVESPPIHLPEMTSPLGKSSMQTITLSNPLSKPIDIGINISNKRDFGVVKSSLTRDLKESSTPYADTIVSRKSSLSSIRIDPQQSVDLNILFWPSSITEQRSTTVQFLSDDVGNTVYHVYGKGLRPETMPETVISSKIGDTSSAFIAFYNPFVDPIPIDVYWEHQGEIKGKKPGSRRASVSRSDAHRHTEAFQLIHNQGSRFHHVVNPFDYEEIPFTFTPKTMNSAHANLIVEIKGQLKWTYPIKGIPEAEVGDAIQTFESKVRDTFAQGFAVTMEGFCDVEAVRKKKEVPWEEYLEYSMESPLSMSDVKADGLTQFELKLSDAKMENPNVFRLETRFHIQFKATKPMDSVYTLLITSKLSGGRWRFPVRVLIHPPPVDDRIVIEGSIGKLSVVSFAIENNSSTPKPFKAYFTRDSPVEFAVQPTQGALMPTHLSETSSNPDLNKFSISYKPSIYGKTLVGTFIIETEDDSWSYEIKGVPPQYEPQRLGTARSTATERGGLSSASSKFTIISSLSSVAKVKLTEKGKPNFIKLNALNPAVTKVKYGVGAAVKNWMD